MVLGIIYNRHIYEKELDVVKIPLGMMSWSQIRRAKDQLIEYATGIAQKLNADIVVVRVSSLNIEKPLSKKDMKQGKTSMKCLELFLYKFEIR